MLNLTDIALRIAHPEKCDISDFADLKSFSEQYPYCQVFPILSLKALSNHNDLRFDVELAQLAYRISDRSQLYALIHQNVAVTSNESQSEETEKTTESSTLLRIVTADDENIENEIAQPTEETTSVSIEESEEENDAEFIPLNISSSEEKELQDDQPLVVGESETPTDVVLDVESKDDLVNEEPEIDEFEQRMLAETISSAYRLEDLEPEEETSSEEQDTILDDEEQVEEEWVDSKERSFSDWLRIGKTSSTEDIEEDKSKLDDILDRFIENEPKISRPKAPVEDKPKRPFYSPEKKARESVDMQHMPVSETLGKIFELQGNYPKAIFVYEQLILANPEKKSYFAARIEELNKKINS
jgi:hypothetical protein